MGVLILILVFGGVDFLSGVILIFLKVVLVVDLEIKEPTRNLNLEKFTEKNEKLPLDLQKEPPYLKKFTSRSRKYIQPHQSKNKVTIGKVLKVPP